MTESRELRLWQACTDGDLEIVKELADDSAVDINWVGEDRLDTPSIVPAGLDIWELWRRC